MDDVIKNKLKKNDKKIVVIYDEIYDTYRKEQKGKNDYEKILRFFNPPVLIIKVLSEIYNIKDEIEYISYSSYELITTQIYINKEKKSLYETLYILYSINKCELPNNDKGNIKNILSKNSQILINQLNNNDMVHIHLYNILNEFQEVYEYILFCYNKCYENYTSTFFYTNHIYNNNIIKNIIKLKRYKYDICRKYKNISFQNILNKFINVLNLCTKFTNNYQNVECIIFYVYLYIFLSIPIFIFPWYNIDNKLNNKILNDGNINIIPNIIEKYRKNFFSYILNNIIDKIGCYETYDFNIALLLYYANKRQTNISISLSQENDKKKKDDDRNILSEGETNKLYINKINEYYVFKHIGYNTLSQFYKPHFYYMTVLKKTFIYNKKMKSIENLFYTLTNQLLQMDESYMNDIKKKKL
ncbi:conserved Plasmodium protein, unknown function [Plasmodium sp. gorilla clade G2]|uniref:conserved Plasmodium protein, unknown function n=1 Tax=Plasmodium sp. gorilla clade G2 TaxID=880535 RepID=UPI000D21F53E|nr:conserved Plasmodium protein, unknown function [Plasmodium sp. gorilla clade G2]SOV19617.1 conserved Plasmodium protein, unknown function [Plasmodium sp. gorilla clade G2]